MSKYSQGQFFPKNLQKIIGNSVIRYRSSWELLMMSYLDNHPDVIQWASESIKIPYRNPLTGQRSEYVPDFLVFYKDKNGKKRTELVEIKPKRETMMENAKSRRDKAFLMVNTAKWAACLLFCKKHGIEFRVMTEDSLFAKNGNSLKRK
jgi:hypothetical protein